MWLLQLGIRRSWSRKDCTKSVGAPVLWDYVAVKEILRPLARFAMLGFQRSWLTEALSKHLAHSSVTTTEIYGEILDDRAQEEYQKFAPKIDI